MFGRMCLVILATASVVGCGDSSHSGRATQAILRVLLSDKVLGDELKAKQANTPSALAANIAQYCDKAEQVDCSDCPPDFTVAYRQHIRAWRAMATAIGQLPDNVVIGFIAGAMNAMLRGEVDGGLGRLEGDVKRASERITATWEEVERTGAKYGAAL